MAHAERLARLELDFKNVFIVEAADEADRLKRSGAEGLGLEYVFMTSDVSSEISATD